jgi:hypothetical protein
MSLKRKMLAAAASAAALALSACTTGFPAQVQRFQAMPAPQGESFVIQAADPRNQGGLEFAQYADMVRNHLVALGYSEAPSADQATMVVSVDYGVDDGRERIVSYPDPWGYGWGGYGWGGWPGYGYGRHPYYWGWHDPFWGGGYGYDVRSYTVFTSFLDIDINRTSDGQALFEGLAQARSRDNALPELVPNLIDAMFTGFPGNSGETVRITVAPPPEEQRRAQGY